MNENEINPAEVDSESTSSNEGLTEVSRNISEDIKSKSQSNPDQGNSDDSLESEESSTRWKEGDEISLVRVRFPGNSRSFPFLQGKRTFAYGQKVVAMSDRGMDVGYINSFPYTVKFKKDMLPIRSISKAADQTDIEAMQGNIDEQKKAEMKAVQIIEKLGLDMQITHVEIIQFGKKMVFYFTAPSRVDFRELVKQLVGELKMRIELRQISVRDRAAALGSIGSCGLATCCSTFLKNYGNVTIKMAKNQNLALIPSKINGVCGQIKCCIKYEDHVYTDKRKTLPREGMFLKAKNGDIGKVTKLHILIEQFDMITEKGQIRRYAKSQFSQGKNLGKDYKFPESFRHVVNETSQVIGLEEMESEMASHFNANLSDDEKAMANIKALKNESHIVKKDDTSSSNSTSDTSIDPSEDNQKREVNSKEASQNEGSSETHSQPRKKKSSKRSGNRPNKSNQQGRSKSQRNDRSSSDSAQGKNQSSDSQNKKARNNRKRRRKKSGTSKEGQKNQNSSSQGDQS